MTLISLPHHREIYCLLNILVWLREPEDEISVRLLLKQIRNTAPEEKHYSLHNQEFHVPLSRNSISTGTQMLAPGVVDFALMANRQCVHAIRLSTLP
jgi:hypothetical protein